MIKMKKYIFIIMAMLLISISPVYAKEKVKYSSCIDGDTIKVILNNKKVTVRLLAVDAPEIAKEGIKAQYYGNEARRCYL